MEPEERAKLIDEWINNPSCHAKFMHDPVKFIENWGYELDDMSKTKLAAWHELSEKEIEERINKGTC